MAFRRHRYFRAFSASLLCALASLLLLGNGVAGAGVKLCGIGHNTPNSATPTIYSKKHTSSHVGCPCCGHPQGAPDVRPCCDLNGDRHAASRNQLMVSGSITPVRLLVTAPFLVRPLVSPSLGIESPGVVQGGPIIYLTDFKLLC